MRDSVMTKRSIISITFQQCVDEEGWIISDLRIYKSRPLSRNQLQKLNMPSNAHNSTDTTRSWTKLPPKEVEFQDFSNNMHIQAI